MLKTILVTIIVLSALTIITNLIPDQMTTDINDAFVYFLSTLNSLNTFSIPIMGAVFNSIQILGNFAVALSIFFTIKFFLNMIA